VGDIISTQKAGVTALGLGPSTKTTRLKRIWTGAANLVRPLSLPELEYRLAIHRSEPDMGIVRCGARSEGITSLPASRHGTSACTGAGILEDGRGTRWMKRDQRLVGLWGEEVRDMHGVAAEAVRAAATVRATIEMRARWGAWHSMRMRTAEATREPPRCAVGSAERESEENLCGASH
jgi:hypothetical protein